MCAKFVEGEYAVRCTPQEGTWATRARPSDPTTTAYCVDAVFEVPWTGVASGNAGAGLFFTDATGVVYWYSGGGVLQFGRYSTATAFAGNDAEVAMVGE